VMLTEVAPAASSADDALLMLANAPVPSLACKSLECKFVRSVAEMERFCVSTLKRKRLLLVTPARVTMRIQIKLARVRAKGMPTHTKRPIPMMMVVIVLILSR